LKTGREQIPLFVITVSSVISTARGEGGGPKLYRRRLYASKLELLLPTASGAD
jgi:hypothetical protein